MPYSGFIAELLCLDKKCDWVKINLNQTPIAVIQLALIKIKV